MQPHLVEKVQITSESGRVLTLVPCLKKRRKRLVGVHKCTKGCNYFYGHTQDHKGIFCIFGSPRSAYETRNILYERQGFMKYYTDESEVG